ncbi:MAG: hypothetical protein GFH27_549305n216 [Chloroflexi bacterium AL-W]|nr:hypothetical protein [Chloroflexi bacterium AL-N1]NOK71234.1 hypothetical protein [Chloroflexi bacterium AL-N10]NOK76523.1 hypothetical protein [Chloroflexi bacterium AL-N5]NOK83640.1 hypothetical protein [Chloroflexi bacterium AL-W]NOK92238.1 hypothetical protein [Chloroflexi bacterium AL-N15]
MFGQRLKSLLLSVSIFLFFAFFSFYDYSQNAPTTGEIVSISAGLILGIGLSLYFNQFWDPVELRPTKPDTTDPNTGWLRNAQVISVLLGITLSAISRIILGQAITSIIAVGLGSVGVVFFLSFTLRLLWYWPR